MTRETDRPSQQDAVNRVFYERPGAVAGFPGDAPLEPSLVMTLIKYRENLVGQQVLDIGVGTGRTTPYLSRFAKDYVGIDYSEAMVAHCRDRFPGLRFDVCDARDLGRFTAGSFGLAVFSYNGIGSIDHAGRLLVLAEVARTLRPGGIFAFSAHNRRYAKAREGPRLQWSRNPITELHNVFEWLRKVRNHARLRRLEVDLQEYALVNDAGQGFTLLHYYITKEEQRRQLEEAGLEFVETYDRSGSLLPDGTSDQETSSIWYVARKPS